MQGSDTIRAFAAVEAPAEVRDYFRRLCAQLSKRIHGAKWTNPGGIHLTLKFLGDVPLSSVDEISAAIGGACAGAGRCELTTSAIGVFPSPRAARVLWAGCDDAAGRTAALQSKIDAALTPLGFEPEKRAFKPHFTLARFRTPALVHSDILSVRVEMLSFTVSEVVLFKSTLRPDGAVYTKLNSFPLT